MTEKSPLEIIDRFARAVEQHPGALPLTAQERETIARVTKFYNRLDALAWFFGWGKWAAAFLIFAATQWDRLAAAWRGWAGG
jgi:hypothetical protein